MSGIRNSITTLKQEPEGHAFTRAIKNARPQDATALPKAQ